MATIMRNAPHRFRTMVRDQFPGGAYVADKPYAVALLAALLVVFFIKSMIPPSSSSTTSGNSIMSFFNTADASTGSSGGGSGSNSMASNPPYRRNLLTKETMEEYYRLGFDDAIAQKEFGTALPAEVPGGGAGDSSTMSNTRMMMDDELPDYPMPPPPRSSFSGGGLLGKMLNLSNAMSIMFLGRTIMELGKDGGGANGGSWQMTRFLQNVQTLEPLKLGLLGLSVYRLVSAFWS